MLTTVYALHSEDVHAHWLSSAHPLTVCCLQGFHIDPPRWAKYVQLRLLTHYGSEPVCALNDVRVYGKSAAEDLEDRLAMEAAADDEAAAQEECSIDEGDAQESNPESQQQLGHRESPRGEQPQDSEPAEQGLADERPSDQQGKVLGKELPQAEPEHKEPDSGARASERESSPEAVASGYQREEGHDSGIMQPASGGSKATIPPVLDILGEGLMRLIVPPGAGKKRSAYSGAPTDPQALPQPDSPMPRPEVDR